MATATDTKTLGALLKSLREKRGHTQETVAKAFKYKSPQFISNMERGICAIPLESLPVFAFLYSVKVETLVDAWTKSQHQRALEIIKRVPINNDFRVKIAARIQA